MNSSDALTFAAVIVILTVTPGVDMALVMRAVLAGGYRAIWPTLAGILTGVAVHVTASITGLSLVLSRSDLAYDVIRLAGAAWLAWLGFGSIRAARRPATHGEQDLLPSPTRARLYVTGFTTNILNVKIALFYLAFLPQFAEPGPGFVRRALAVTAVQVVVGMSWLMLWGLITLRLARGGDDTAPDARDRRRARLELATGVILVLLAVRLALAAGGA